ncbi:FMN-dependent NADH-azoreductase [Tistlia consotensis]|uniref:FMN dependent NADH:quinone oxidoreductase n=1 Tax=Tistlia consotensis USBA 355 TaxID=560819 RepID=A0A1Y6C7E9_9PROT|nr:NAD(P)H-dependent oxidoreductase [Tistlia consotensis]SMF47912.1 FMN-dependent NADH-azoreductase [Tistlia consotensis USBA 355]SNR82108.1 FMN-dependent NADH-azoreductase [Tistlia consotensis]
MTSLLHLPISARGEASVSRRIGQRALEAFRRAIPGLRIVGRDLGREPLPHPDPAFVAANLTAEAERGPAERAALTLSERLIAELEAADLLLISTPMHNFTVPSALKAWIDFVVRPGATFRSSPAGKVGLLADRPVFVVAACGGRFGTAPGAQQDFLGPYLTYLFATIGLTSVEILRLDALGRGGTALERAEAAAAGWIAAQASTLPERFRKAG